MLFINTNTKELVTEHDVRLAYPEVSLPAIMSAEDVPAGYALVSIENDELPCNLFQVNELGDVRKVKGEYVTKWVLNTKIISDDEFRRFLKSVADHKAHEIAIKYHYESTDQMISFIGDSTSKFDLEGKSMRQYRSKLRSVAEQLHEDYLSKVLKLEDVTVDLILRSLPEFTMLG